MKAHFFLILLLTAVSVSAAKKKDNTYIKIYKKTLIDGTMEYGTQDFEDSKSERTFLKDMKNKLDEEYKAAQKEYRTAFDEFRKSNDKDKKPPARIHKPTYKLESKKFSGKDKAKAEEALKEKQEEAAKHNEKLKKE